MFFFRKEHKKTSKKRKNGKLTCNAALVAVSKTSLTPSLLLAEHSRYANALIFSAIVLPSSGLTGSCFIFPNSFIVLLSFLKSCGNKYGCSSLVIVLPRFLPFCFQQELSGHLDRSALLLGSIFPVYFRVSQENLWRNT